MDKKSRPLCCNWCRYNAKIYPSIEETMKHLSEHELECSFEYILWIEEKYDIYQANNTALTKELDKAVEVLKKGLVADNYDEIAEFRKSITTFLASLDKPIETVAKSGTKLDGLLPFALEIIKQGMNGNIDGFEIQEMAVKYGLLKELVATEKDVNNESDFGIGDTIFKPTGLLASLDKPEPIEGDSDEN